MDNSVTQDIKDRLSIEEVTSWYLKLDKTGINFKAKCPFHNEKTASFFISPDRGSFYCFGCQKGGDIFTFVQEIEGVDFKDALKILTEKAGVELKFDAVNREQSTVKSKEKDILLKINEEATVFFEKVLEKNEIAQKYLKDRGVEEKTIKKFRIGFVEDEWQSLYDFLKQKGFNDDQIIKSGLAIKSSKGSIYDRFRGRIIFPISDEKGSVIAYSARITKEKSLPEGRQEPKYINSPETPLFNKSKNLYGFNFAKQTIRKHDFAILVEGQMDVIMAHQAGYTNTIASSGTSFTEEQLKIIKRHTNNLLISFDGDSAGINSSRKVWELALNNDMDVKVIAIESNQDPADIIKNSIDEWKKLVKNSKHIIEYFADNILEKIDDKRKRQKHLQTDLYPYIRSLKSYTDKSYFIDLLAEKFSVDKDIIWSDVNSKESEEIIENDNQKTNKKSENTFDAKKVLYGIYLLGKTKEGFLEELKKYISENEIETFEKEKEEILFKTEELIKNENDLKRFVNEVSSPLKILKLEEEKKNLNKEFLSDSGEDADSMNKIIEISREIENVKKEGCEDLSKMV